MCLSLSFLIYNHNKFLMHGYINRVFIPQSFMKENNTLCFLEWGSISIAQSWWEKVCCYSTELPVSHSVKENASQRRQQFWLKCIHGVKRPGFWVFCYHRLFLFVLVYYCITVVNMMYLFSSLTPKTTLSFRYCD